MNWSVNALSGWWLISTFVIQYTMVYYSAVSMPSRADDSFLLKAEIRKVAEKNVSMPSRADDSFLRIDRWYRMEN